MSIEWGAKIVRPFLVGELLSEISAVFARMGIPGVDVGAFLALRNGRYLRDGDVPESAPDDVRIPGDTDLDLLIGAPYDYATLFTVQDFGSPDVPEDMTDPDSGVWMRVEPWRNNSSVILGIVTVAAAARLAGADVIDDALLLGGRVRSPESIIDSLEKVNIDRGTPFGDASGLILAGLTSSLRFPS